jgi:hypothetical protein
MYNDAMFFKEEAQKLDPTPENDPLLWRYLRTSIILSLTSLEAYVNTFISDYISSTSKLPDMAQEFTKRRMSLNMKLEYILPLTLDRRMDKTTKEWTDYQTIRRIRSRLVNYTKGDEIYKEKALYGINMANVEKGLEMVRGMVKQLCALAKQKYPSWVDQTQSWIQVKIENSTPI